jgi:hypothetical protein
MRRPRGKKCKAIPHRFRSFAENAGLQEFYQNQNYGHRMKLVRLRENINKQTRTVRRYLHICSLGGRAHLFRKSVTKSMCKFQAIPVAISLCTASIQPTKFANACLSKVLALSF